MSVDQGVKSDLKPLLEHAQSWLRHLQRGEAFFKNQFNVGKNVLDPKCFTPLKCNIVSVDNYQKSSLFDEHCQIPLARLESLPPPLLVIRLCPSAMVCSIRGVNPKN